MPVKASATGRKVPAKSSETTAVKQSKEKKSKRVESWNIYIYKVLKEVHGDNYRISTKTILIMNHLLVDIFERLALEASLLCKRTKKKTMTDNDIQSAVKLLLPGELAYHAMSEGTKAIRLYENNQR